MSSPRWKGVSSSGSAWQAPDEHVSNAASGVVCEWGLWHAPQTAWCGSDSGVNSAMSGCIAWQPPQVLASGTIGPPTAPAAV